MKYLLIFLLFSISAFSSDIDREFINGLKENGRSGLHGMVLFGNDPYYMAHIPMLNMPHDMQIVVEVELSQRNGEKIEVDLSGDTFSIRPLQRFSLNNYAKNTLKRFEGSVFKGSFETNGILIQSLRSVVFKIKKQIIVRPLPSFSQKESILLEDKDNEFKVNMVTPENNIQEIVNLTLGKRLWCVVGPDFFSPCP